MKKRAFVFVSLFLACLVLPRVLSSSAEETTFVRATTAARHKNVPDDDAKETGTDWKTASNCAAKGFDDPSAIRCDYCRFALKEALQDEEITRECLECCTETTTTGDDAGLKGEMMMVSSFDRATITACS